jgi:2-C-methyl-D-erythritol 4-phosphate cytidylyltransferase/2-C-methyl-D-erythritol 2,4-cyclodiphosphate synthase
MNAGAIVVAAGDGTRLPGPVPKPLLPLGRRTVLERALEAFQACARIDRIVVAAGAGYRETVAAIAPPKVASVVEGGRTRRASVAAGLRALSDVEWVVVHDGARPFVTPALIERVLDAAAEHGAATAGLPVSDTIKEVERDRVRRTIPRDGLFSAQTPQAFRADLLREAHDRVPPDAPITDDAGLVEYLGGAVAVVPGDPVNVKVTTPADYEMARRQVERPPGRAVRVGVGYDVHRLTAAAPLILGGVRIPSARGLSGHSDADALVHAIMDALLGAAALPDIGAHFPPDDPRYAGAESIALLASVAARVRSAGWTVGNVDAVVQAEAPRLASHIDAMRERIAAALGATPGQIGVKATTAEGLDAVGRGEGIAAHAIVLLERID